MITSMVTGELYYSKQQYELFEQMADDRICSHFRFFGIVGDQEVEYTELILDGRQSNFPDAVYLGRGILCKVEELTFVAQIKPTNQEEFNEALEEAMYIEAYRAGMMEYVSPWPDIIGD